MLSNRNNLLYSLLEKLLLKSVIFFILRRLMVYNRRKKCHRKRHKIYKDGLQNRHRK